MNIYLQMMILGMFLKYCYALTRIQQKKKKWRNEVALIVWRELKCYQALLYFPPST